MIDAQFVRDYIPAPGACLYMIAGPPGMDEAMAKTLAEAGVENKNVLVERFTGY